MRRGFRAHRRCRFLKKMGKENKESALSHGGKFGSRIWGEIEIGGDYTTCLSAIEV